MKKQLLTLLSAFSFAVTLNAQTTVTLGAGTATAGANVNTTPISRYYENTHFQVVYTAAELTAQGAVAGSITKIGWYVEVASSGLPAYTIKMANTTATSSANYNATSTSIVYGPVTYSPVVGGFDLLTLTTPFAWDGSSNLLVDVCMTGAPYVSPYGTVRTYSATSGSSSVEDDNTGVSNCGNPTSGIWSYKPQVSFVINLASCLAPSALSVANITSSSADLSWSAPVTSTPVSYQGEVRTSGVAGSGATGRVFTGVVPASTTTANVTSLTSGTAYMVYVRSICGPGDTSSWVSKSFNTQCNTMPISVTEGFNAATIPNCWSVESVTLQTGSKITFTTTTLYPTTNPSEGSHFVRYNSFNSANGSDGAEERLVSLPLSSIGVSTGVVVDFAWRNNNGDYSTGAYLNEGVTVQYSLNGTTWTDVQFFARHDGSLAVDSAAWKTKTVTLPVAVNNQTVFMVAFKFHSEYGDNCSLDNVNIRTALPTSVKQLSGSNVVTLYPNPTNGVVSVNGITSASTIEVYDAIGKLVMSDVLTKQSTTINVAGLQNGVYVVKVISNNQEVKIGKLIKQ